MHGILKFCLEIDATSDKEQRMSANLIVDPHDVLTQNAYAQRIQRAIQRSRERDRSPAWNRQPGPELMVKDKTGQSRRDEQRDG